MDENCCALVIGLCSHGLAISRSLRHHGIEVHAFEANPLAPGFKTNSATVHRVKSINKDTLVEDLLKFRAIISSDKDIVLFPTNDNNVRIIAEHIGDIKGLFKVSWSECSSTIKNLLLKSNIEQRCVDTGLLYPKSIIANDIRSLDELLPKLRNPFIVKPVNPQSGFKALKFQTRRSLLDGLSNFTKDFPVIVQEWVPGTAEDLYFCALYLDKGKPLQSMIGRKLESYPPALGQTTVAITCYSEELVNLTCRFFDGLDISGPVSVEFKRDHKGKYWLIEPTVGRSDFWLGLCIAAGFDLPLMEMEAAMGKPHKPPSFNTPTNTIWFDSDRDPVAPFRHSFHWLSLSAQAYYPVFSYLNLHDMLPFWRALSQTIARLTGAALKGNPGKSEVSKKARLDGTIQVFDSFASIPEKFKHLMDQYSEDYVFFDIAWLENFRENVASLIGTPEILCLSDHNDNALAVLPILKHDAKFHGVNLRKISSLSNYYTPRFEIFTDAALCDRKTAFQHFLEHLKNEKRAWDVIEIFPMFRESIVDVRGINCISYPYYITENFQLSIEGDYSAYLYSRPSKHVNTIKRKLRKLGREKDFIIDINCGDDHTAEIMDNYHAVYRSSWKIDEPYPNFIDGLVRWAADRGSLRLGRLIIENQVVASQIWIVANKTAYIYKLAYDRRFREYSPGTLLTCAMLERVIENDQVQRIDFLLGNDRFKKDWMDISTSVYGVQIPNTKTLKGKALSIFNTFSSLKRNWISRQSWHDSTG